MKLSKRALKIIKEKRLLMMSIAISLGYTEQWMLVLLKRNHDNSPLTTVKAVQIIQSETGLNQDEILEEVPIKA